jgi:hypothetical protein
MKKSIPIIATVFAAVGLTLATSGVASAANETATAGLTLTPQSGTLYKNALRPVNFRADVEVKAPLSSPKVNPMKRVKITFPSDMKFVPKSNTPVCSNSRVGPNTNLSFPPDTIIARCPTAVLGNGTAGLYLAGNNNATGPTLKDPVLIVFNGGKNSEGLPKIKIYGYSQGTGAGIYMEGVLRNSVLDISIPVLTFDSAVGDFNLNIPGDNSPFANRRGKDRTYVQAKCSTGSWTTDAMFTLGTRNTAGDPTSPDTFINAPAFKESCNGAVGRARFGNVTVKGAKSIRRGGSTVYRVTLRNNGTNVANGVRIGVGGKWVKRHSQRVSKMPAGSSRTVKVRAGLTRSAKKGKKTAIKFRMTAAKTNAKVKTFGVKVR